MYVALVRGPLNNLPTPPPKKEEDMHQLFVDHYWQDRAIRERFNHDVP